MLEFSIILAAAHEVKSFSGKKGEASCLKGAEQCDGPKNDFGALVKQKYMFDRHELLWFYLNIL